MPIVMVSDEDRPDAHRFHDPFSRLLDRAHSGAPHGEPVGRGPQSRNAADKRSAFRPNRGSNAGEKNSSSSRSKAWPLLSYLLNRGEQGARAQVCWP